MADQNAPDWGSPPETTLDDLFTPPEHRAVKALRTIEARMGWKRPAWWKVHEARRIAHQTLALLTKDPK